MQDEKRRTDEPERRDFLKKAGIIVLGGAAALPPIAAGLMVFTDPLRRQFRASTEVKVTSLDTLPADGVPRRFGIVSDRSDAWNTYPKAPLGAVYLRRTEDGEIKAFNVACPHAGCFVSYQAAKKTFFCPCHDSSFELSGAIANPGSPSPRGLDSLDVEVRNGNEVWVRFQNFKPGTSEKTPIV